MVRYYVANANGDYWTMESAHDVLWVISEDELKRLNPHIPLNEMDKLEGDIWRYGKKINLAIEEAN